LYSCCQWMLDSLGNVHWRCCSSRTEKIVDCTWIARHIFFATKHAPFTLLSCTRKCKLHDCINFFIHFVPGAFLVNWRCFNDSVPKVFSYLAISWFAKLPLHLNSLQIDTSRFYLHSKLDCSKKLVNVTRITGTVKGVTGYVIRVVITNARATSILTCDRIAS
jgi:hypothetical protein